jgi:hypothetical protein
VFTSNVGSLTVDEVVQVLLPVGLNSRTAAASEAGTRSQVLRLRWVQLGCGRGRSADHNWKSIEAFPDLLSGHDETTVPQQFCNQTAWMHHYP